MHHRSSTSACLHLSCLFLHRSIPYLLVFNFSSLTFSLSPAGYWLAYVILLYSYPTKSLYLIISRFLPSELSVLSSSYFLIDSSIKCIECAHFLEFGRFCFREKLRGSRIFSANSAFFLRTSSIDRVLSTSIAPYILLSGYHLHTDYLMISSRTFSRIPKHCSSSAIHFSCRLPSTPASSRPLSTLAASNTVTKNSSVPSSISSLDPQSLLRSGAVGQRRSYAMMPGGLKMGGGMKKGEALEQFVSTNTCSRLYATSCRFRATSLTGRFYIILLRAWISRQQLEMERWTPLLEGKKRSRELSKVCSLQGIKDVETQADADKSVRLPTRSPQSSDKIESCSARPSRCGKDRYFGGSRSTYR